MTELLITRATCLAVTGFSWTFIQRWCKDHNVPLITMGKGRKKAIPAALFRLAMERELEAQAPKAPTDAETERLIAVELVALQKQISSGRRPRKRATQG